MPSSTTGGSLPWKPLDCAAGCGPCSCSSRSSVCSRACPTTVDASRGGAGGLRPSLSRRVVVVTQRGSQRACRGTALCLSLCLEWTVPLVSTGLCRGYGAPQPCRLRSHQKRVGDSTKVRGSVSQWLAEPSSAPSPCTHCRSDNGNRSVRESSNVSRPWTGAGTASSPSSRRDQRLGVGVGLPRCTSTPAAFCCNSRDAKPS